MIYLLIKSVNPDTRVGVHDLKRKIQAARLSAHGHNVKAMLDDMAQNYRQILEADQTHDDFLYNLFDALLSSKNSVFNNYIQHEKNLWEKGQDVNSDDLIDLALVKYNNLVKQLVNW